LDCYMKKPNETPALLNAYQYILKAGCRDHSICSTKPAE
jgi:hypothetical protein